MASKDAFEQSYRFLSGDDSDERACSAIPDGACTEVPRNYVLNVSNGAATKLAEQLAGPNLVLPWIMSSIGAPSALAALLMPIKQVGSLAPQLLISAQIRRLARRKWAWVAAGSLQALLLMLIALVVLRLEGSVAGALIVALFALFAIASGMGSVAFQDVTGKTVPKGRRGRMLANRATIGGILTLIAGLLINQYLGEDSGLSAYVWLIVLAAVLWALGAALFALINEVPGATEGGRNLWQELRFGLSRVREVSAFRQYLGVRALLLSIEVAMPFYALHARELFGGAAQALGVFVITVGIANIISSPFWGRFADTAVQKVLLWSGVMGAIAGALALLTGVLPEDLRHPLVYAAVFVVLGVAEAGVRLGRKTWLVDAAPDEERPTWVAFSNTSIGVLALAAGGLGLLADMTRIEVVIGLLMLLSLIGAALCLRLPAPDTVYRPSLTKASDDE